jgi:hypothetical protein
MPRWPAEARRTAGALGAAAALALSPKCLLCLLAYAGMGAALGLPARELCGGSPGGAGAWAPVLGVAAAGLGLACFLVRKAWAAPTRRG